MKKDEHKAIVEGLLFASGDDGITIRQIVKVLEIDKSSVKHILDELSNDYMQMDKGIMIMQADEVFHLTTKPEHSHFYKKLLETPQTNRMSQAALETLAIIAYKQPITRVEIEEIRGVRSDRAVQTLLNRSLIEEVGRKDAVGRPILYATNKVFLTYFGLTSLEELPPLPEDIDKDVIEQEASLFFQQIENE